MAHINNDWDEILKDDFKSQSYLNLIKFLIEEYKNHVVYPKMHDIYHALMSTSYENTKIVILGQDPYHGINQAMGMSFSVNKGVKIPKSLLNIFKELKIEYGFEIPSHGNLENWAKQGVLLLNTILTVREASPMSHKDKGWECLTDSIIKKLSNRDKPLVFMLWGRESRKKKDLIDTSKHLVLESPHPSPLSASKGFFNNNHFKLANEFLKKNNIKEIDWEIK